ncbi:LysR family transcriptional regulator [Bacillus sp. ISL-40]|uniref:LysR family transcriptional regulator n=1 Tax=unclassified Bacillus (in: firmicutes) TaxID=185979 RepID=UPI001BE5B11E|nr:MULTISPECIES: LysR family transcriptional regulator [unclassified Bacillus (in: firmicutes)]MBT2697640.1 LysR family transcriptional regulator [Bacillus sp. ISL-40]MBT2744609.1 LysR family transcriptional regulator [Bacillus sp. ISL-77]
MEFLQLQYFQTVARLEHMTKAAEELQIAQPSLSKTIARLEEDLGVPLFDRKNRQLRLNDYGKLFLDRVNRIFLELNEGKREIAERAHQRQTQITLAVSIPRVLPELLSSFLKLFPEIKFQQVLESTSSMKSRLEKAEIDFGISSVPIEGTDIIWEPLMTEEIYLIVPPEHRLSRREEIFLNEVKDEPIIGMNTGFGFRNLTDEFCRKAGFVPNIAFEGDEPGVIGELVKQGLGIAFIPEISWLHHTNPFPNKLRIIEPKCQRTIGLGWSKRRYLSEAGQEFRQYVIEYFSKLSL